MNTGSTDLRDTEVQQPKTTATLSWLISSRAFSANSGQSDAGSTTTASSFLPSRPPFLFCSSMSMSMTSFSVVSEIAIVPDSECRMPTLIVSSAAEAGAASGTAKAAAIAAAPATLRIMFIQHSPCSSGRHWEDADARIRKGACQGVQGRNARRSGGIRGACDEYFRQCSTPE